MKTRQSNGAIKIEVEIKDNAISTSIEGNHNLKAIQKRKEYVNSTK